MPKIGWKTPSWRAGSAGRLISFIEKKNYAEIDGILARSSGNERQDLLDLGLCYCCGHGPDEYAHQFLANGANASCELENRLHPLSLAAHYGRTGIMRSLLQDHRVKVDLPDKENRTALMYARNTEAVDILLGAGANLEAEDKDGNTALMIAILHHRKTEVIQLLIERGASIEAYDLRRRTVLIQAVWKNRIPIVEMLLDRKVNIAQTDQRKRNVLHHLASDIARTDEDDPKRKTRKQNKRVSSQLRPTQHGRPSATIRADESKRKARKSKKKRRRDRNGFRLINILLDKDPNGELAAAQDELDRTTLHWAAVSGNSKLVQMLVSRLRGSIDKLERKKRTALHFAVANNHTKIVEILLHNSANVNAKTDTGLTPLHIACFSSTAKTSTVKKLVEDYKARVSRRNRSGATAVHLAAQAGNWSIVEYLLGHPMSDVNAKTDAGMTPLHIACASANTLVRTVSSLIDVFKAKVDLKNRSGKTILHLAAQAGNWPVVEHLLHLPGIDLKDRDDFGNTPLIYAAAHKNDDSEDRRKIIEAFSPWRNPALVTGDAKHAAMNCEAIIMDFPREPGMEPKVRKRTVHDLLYAPHQKDRERPAVTISHQQSTSFRWIHLPANNTAWCLDLLTKDFIEKGARDLHTFIALERSFNHQHRGLEPHSKYMTPLCQTIIRSWSRNSDNSPHIDFSDHKPSVAIAAERDMLPAKLWAIASAARPLSSRRLSTTPLSRKKAQKLRAKLWPQPRLVSQKTNNEVESHDATVSSMYLFTPFLHFEVLRDRQDMQDLADKVFKGQGVATLDMSPGEALFRAYLQAPNFPLHMRRTLDQFFYRNIDTTDRDQDQVIHRYQTKPGAFPEDHVVKLLMVDQLWMWVLHDDLVLTSFPQRWNDNQPEGGDRSSMWEDIREVILSSNRDPVRDVHDLAMMITGRCFGAFDRHRLNSYDLQFLEMFEASIGDALDKEVKLFESFNVSSQEAYRWLSSDAPAIQDHSRGIRGTGRRTPGFIKNLFNIGPETDLLKDIKDIIDELDMLTMLFECQEKQVLPHLQDAMTEIAQQRGWSGAIQQKVAKVFVEHQRIIAHPKQDVERMKNLAMRIERSIKDLLDLKQKQVNVIEARASRTQAENTASQGNILMIFTTFSVIFLPLSFIASVFSINISQLPQGNNGNLLSIRFVTKYLFGVGIPIAVICVLIALGVEQMTVYFWRGWGWLVQWVTDKQTEVIEERMRKRSSQGLEWQRQMVVASIPPQERGKLRSKAKTRIDSSGWENQRPPRHLGPPGYTPWNTGQPLQPPKYTPQGGGNAI